MGCHWKSRSVMVFLVERNYFEKIDAPWSFWALHQIQVTFFSENYNRKMGWYRRQFNQIVIWIITCFFFRCAERVTPPSGRSAIPLFTSPESCSSILLEVLAKGGFEMVQQQQRWHSTEQLIPSYLSSPPLCWFYAATNGRNVKG